MVASIRPCGDNILVLRMKEEEKSPGGIFIPQEARSKADRGRVLAVGPGRWNQAGSARIPMDVKVKDIVLLPKYAGAEDMRGALEERQLLIREEDVLGVEMKGG